MQLNVQITDVNLQEQLTQYISKKKIEANDLLVELLQHFLQEDKSVLHYKTKNPELSATTLDFDLESDKDYKLFQDVDDVKSYTKELRANAWK